MVRKPHGPDSDSFDTARRPKKPRKRRFPVVWLVLATLAVFVALLPRLIVNRSIVLAAIDRFAGLKPLRIDVASVHAGWFSPVSVSGLQVSDAQGNVLAKVAHVQTQKGLWSWITASAQLGSLELRDVEVDIESFDGTTNIEKAIEHLTKSSPNPTSQTKSSSRTFPTGSIEIANARIRMRLRANPEEWLVTLPRIRAALPNASQIIGPIQLEATIAPAVAARGPGGAIAAELTEADYGGTNGLAFRAALNTVPLAFWRVIRDRVPDIPVDAVEGSLSAQVAGSYVDGEHWSFDVQQLDCSQLRVDAPNLVGTQPAQLQKISLVGRCTLTDGRLSIEKGDVQCDFGTAVANGQLPWPVQVPTVTQPWFPGATIDATGTMDLARLVKATKTLIPMRDDTELVSGHAQFRIAQQLDERQQPQSQINVQLSDLVAIASGQQLKWAEPLKVAVTAGPEPDGKIGFSSQIVAEFCDLAGSGNADQGKFTGRIDLDRLQQRLAQLVTLPIRTMAGSASVDLNWLQSEPGSIKADGRIETSPLVIRMTAGGEIREPAWKGTFTTLARLDGSQLRRIDSGNLDFKSEHETLQVDLLQAISLETPGTVSLGPKLPPAAFKVNMRGDIANWQRRAAAFQVTIPETQIAGNLELAASGLIDAQHVELLEANWKSEPFEVSTPQLRLAEPQLLGSFKGHVVTSDFTKLAVEKLEVRATAFSLGAADTAAAGGSGRVGRAAFLVDLGRLMNSMQNAAPTAQPVLPPGTKLPGNAQVTLAGLMKGELGWQVTSQAAAFTLKATGENCEVLSQPSGTVAGGAAERLWIEPTIATQLSGNWLAANNSVALDTLQLQTPWVNFAGSMQYDTNAQQQSIRLKGQCAYDASGVGERLKPWTANHVQLTGQKTVPVEVNWISKAGDKGSLLAGLHAATRIGWDQARVVGIQVGAADVPVSIVDGKLATAAEIPVSGGVLRWDIAGDLASENMMLVQKPMTVLENVAITPEMCQSWLKFVAPLLAEATAVEGRLSLKLNEARLNPVNPRSQLVDGLVIMHNAEVGPGPLTNQVITLVQQINAIRKQDLTQAVSSQRPWVKMPEQEINFHMENGQVLHRNLNIRVGDVTISTSGTVDIDGRMELLADMPIPNDWVDKSPWLASARGRSLQFPVRGTLGGPQVDTQLLRQFGRDTVQQAAQGFLQKELTRGIGKLLGTPTAPQGPTGQ